MKKSMVVINAKYLPVYKSHLDEAGYPYIQEYEAHGKTVMLIAQGENIGKLNRVLNAASRQCGFKLTLPEK